MINKWNPKRPISAVYWNGNKELFYAKRFLLELIEKKELFISDHPKSYLELVSVSNNPGVEIVFKKVKGKERDNSTTNLKEFIAVKGLKALGNRLTAFPVKDMNLIESNDEIDEDIEPEESQKEQDNNDNDQNDSQITLEL